MVICCELQGFVLSGIERKGSGGNRLLFFLVNFRARFVYCNQIAVVADGEKFIADGARGPIYPAGCEALSGPALGSDRTGIDSSGRRRPYGKHADHC